MNYFLLAETDFFRLINEAGDCNMETAYTAFATQVIELCNGGMDMNLTVIALAYIEIELQHHPVRNLSEEKREIAAYVSKALSFVRKMQKFLATPQVPPLISANNDSKYMNRPRRCRFHGYTFSVEFRIQLGIRLLLYRLCLQHLFRSCCQELQEKLLSRSPVSH